MKGSLYQRGKTKTWYLRFDDPNSSKDARKQRNVRIGIMSKSDAQAQARSILHKLDSGIADEARSQQTLTEYLTSWLDNRQANLATTTFVRYKHMIDRDIIPVAGQVRLSKVGSSHLKAVYRAARDRGLSGRSCLHIHRMLHKAFRDAVKETLITRNVVDSVEAPKAEDRQLPPLSNDKVRSLIEVAKGTRLEVPVAVAALTGLRRGEILALRWKNVDLDRGTLYVAESLEQTRLYGVRFKEPKSKTSRRPIPLSPECVEMLRTHRDNQNEQKDAAGLAYGDIDLVFPNPDGRPWPPDTFTVQFGKLAQLVGLKGFRFHDLRHAFASLTLANGVSIKEVSTLMGHSSPTITLSTYARSLEGLGRKAVNDLARSLLAS